MPAKKRVMVFIDGSLFYHALKTIRPNARIDFQHLVK
jgi:hypothetical protein